MLKLSRFKGITLSLAIAAVITIIMVNRVNAIGGPKVEMLIAVNSVKPGVAIKESDIKTVKMPQNFAQNAVTDNKDAVGKSPAVEITAGHPILKTDISNLPMRDGLYQNEVGARVSVDGVSSGGAKPGDLVDVLVSASKPGAGQSAVYSTLLRRKRVVALFNSAGQQIDGSPPQANGGALALSPAGSYVPAVVELAVSEYDRNQLVSAGKVILSINPWESSTPAQSSPTIATNPPRSQPTQPDNTPDQPTGQ